MNLEQRLRNIERQIGSPDNQIWRWVHVEQYSEDAKVYKYEGKFMTADEIKRAAGPHTGLIFVLLWQDPSPSQPPDPENPAQGTERDIAD
jgi:hypothetical protein